MKHGMAFILMAVKPCGMLKPAQGKLQINRSDGSIYSQRWQDKSLLHLFDAAL